MSSSADWAWVVCCVAKVAAACRSLRHFLAESEQCQEEKLHGVAAYWLVPSRFCQMWQPPARHVHSHSLASQSLVDGLRKCSPLGMGLMFEACARCSRPKVKTLAKDL